MADYRKQVAKDILKHANSNIVGDLKKKYGKKVEDPITDDELGAIDATQTPERDLVGSGKKGVMVRIGDDAELRDPAKDELPQPDAKAAADLEHAGANVMAKDRMKMAGGKMPFTVGAQVTAGGINTGNLEPEEYEKLLKLREILAAEDVAGPMQVSFDDEEKLRRLEAERDALLKKLGR